MAQLIKLQDYVSRYAQDIYLYPSRFVRLKQQQWDGMKDKWEQGKVEQADAASNFEQKEGQSVGILKKLKGKLRKSNELQKPEADPFPNGSAESLMEEVIGGIPGNIKSVEQLKQYFLNELMPFQLKWASSTLTETSFIDKDFTRDRTLKFLLQRFPDTFLILYKPIFLLKKAPVEAELIIVTPAAAICISFLEEEADAVFVGSKERFWVKKTKHRQKKVLNPLIALNRTGKIVKSLFDMHGVELPVQKLLLSRNGFIDYPQPPYGIQFIEKRNFESWFKELRRMKSPLKHTQLKAAQVLLQYCQTTAVRRLEWESNPDGDHQ
ncbi:NERD domain-containing protein [Bacillus sp. REN3]|uniref:NERD domain-containing protein n=1 Tax=Bacillus sp. REN3 TaxID=2802440 RepID=UPI001AED9CD6|nr:NERD domain-containing protein [Bacillus sp. REN3]